MIDDAIPDLVSRRNFLRGAVGLAGVASMGALFGCSSGEPSASAMAATGDGPPSGSTPATPKYVFLFIGDGMSYPQIQATAYFNGAQQSGEEPTIERVSFMDFPVIGSQYTYDEAARVMAGGKALLVAEKLADEDALSYAMDATADEWSLRDYVAGYIDAGATYEQAMEDVAQLFGLERPASALSSGAEVDAQVAEAEPGSLMLTAYEGEQLREAYE